MSNSNELIKKERPKTNRISKSSVYPVYPTHRKKIGPKMNVKTKSSFSSQSHKSKLSSIQALYEWR